MVSDLTIDAQHSIHVNGNHGFVWFNCSRIKALRVTVRDYKNSALIGYTFPEAVTDYDDNIIESCVSDGLDAANNGILLVDLVRSGILNCKALRVGKTGSPCYGLQIKNGCQKSFISGGYTSNALIGIACGNNNVSALNTGNIVSNVYVDNCSVGLAWGNVIGNRAENIIIDMNTAGNSAVDFNLDTVSCVVSGVTVKNIDAGKTAVRFRDGDTDNVIRIDTIENSSGLVQLAAQFDSGSLRNSATLIRYSNPTTVSSTSNLVSNASGSQTNVFNYAAIPIRQSEVIASDAVTVRDALVALLRIDTESSAATDDLSTISNPTDGQIITLETTANARDVTVKHGVGNIRLAGAADFVLDTVSDSITLIYKSNVSFWCEVSRANNA
jgi:hypothetical protein